MVYTGSIEILNEISPKIASIKDIIEIETECKKIKPVMSEKQENEKDDVFKILKISVEKKEILNKLDNQKESINIRKRI